MTEYKTPKPIKDIAELDKLIHEPRRFAVLNALARAGNLGYTFLRHITGLSQGNLATHLRKLEEADFIEIRRRYIMRRQYSRIYITEAGRAALNRHWQSLRDLEEQMKNWLPSDEGELDLTQEAFEALPQERPVTENVHNET